MRLCQILLAGILLVLAAGCKPFVHEDDPDPYTGGEVSGLTFQIIGPGVVKLFWQENFTDEDGFYVDRRRWDGQWESRILQAYPDQVCINDIFAELGQVYYYRVYAFKGNSLSLPVEAQFNFYLPPPANLDYDFSWNTPGRIRFFWTNEAAWADSIVVAKRLEGQDWVPRVAVLPGNAVDWTDLDYDVSQTATWSFTTYYQHYVSNPAQITMIPPKREQGMPFRGLIPLRQ